MTYEVLTQDFIRDIWLRVVLNGKTDTVFYWFICPLRLYVVRISYTDMSFFLL